MGADLILALVCVMRDKDVIPQEVFEAVMNEATPNRLVTDATKAILENIEDKSIIPNWMWQMYVEGKK